MAPSWPMVTASSTMTRAPSQTFSSRTTGAQGRIANRSALMEYEQTAGKHSHQWYFVRRFALFDVHSQTEPPQTSVSGPHKPGESLERAWNQKRQAAA